MPETTLYTRQQAIRLSADSDVAELKGQIVAASQGTPAFIEVMAAAGGQVSILVTGQSEIWFETIDRAEDQSAVSEAGLPEFDYYGTEAIFPN